ncbi:unnamed protein product [Rotaria sordida]|uniref:Uncharacterized protein n=1 Tax=Rotaria sordida TaxID=392033 RepID=A0A815I1Z0_9BILA|nr:unnamed protein product [Rotaria sordida]CAF1441408.1 unnamed protein product [Rotaria sordida]CAF1606384.1 unnamed protein product [Rotaria sordida]
MARVADSLLMNLYLNESDDGDHRPSKATSSIISLMENCAINDDTIISLLLSHHRQPDEIQQQAVRILANLCFNRLTAFRAFNDQIQTKKKEDIKEFIQLFCLEFSKMSLSFKGEKDWEFTQIFMTINMDMLKQD